LLRSWQLGVIFLQTLIRVSYGTAIVLGLVKARQDVAPTTAYLLFDQGCIGSCSFCNRANGNVHSENLSRITWPEFTIATVIEKLKQEPPPFSRICLQTGYNPAKEDELKKIIRLFIGTGISTSATLTPLQTDMAMELLDEGLNHVGIGLDAASDKTYAIHKHRDWDKDWPSLKKLMNKATGRIEVHLIFGLGDSEEVFMSRIQAIIDEGGKVSLFAFTPMQEGQAPDLSAYRRVQAFRYLCENKTRRFAQCNFRDGRLTSLGMSKKELITSLDKGNAFRTSGCDACNRPYYNERPGQPFFNFPRPLYNPEFEQAIKQLEIYL
jgi:biotin synthase